MLIEGPETGQQERLSLFSSRQYSLVILRLQVAALYSIGI
jgi:hypothetical protein